MADDALPTVATERTVSGWRGLSWRERLNSRYFLAAIYGLAILLTAVAVWMASSAPITGPVGPRSQAILIVLGLNLVLIVALAATVGWRTICVRS